MTAQLQGLIHGTSGLAIAYVLVLVALLGGLAQARAAAEKYLLAPLLAAPLLLLVAVCVSLLSAVLHAILSGPWTQLLTGFLVTTAIGFVGGRVLALRPGPREPQHRRGAFVAKVRSKSIHAGHSAAPITLAGVSIPLADETKHFKIIGTTGTGKSTAIREILSAALSRGDRMVIADPDAGYLNRYYDPQRGDVILNPFDPDARKWDLFGEITQDYDIEQLARALIPDSGDDDRVWTEYARTLFAEVVRQMKDTGWCDDRKLSRILNKANDDELRAMLEGTPAARFFKEGNEKMLAGAQATLASAVRVFQYTTKHEASPLSVRAWVREGRACRSGVLFLPYKAGEIAALRGLISTWMRLSIIEAMNCEEGDQRLWFIVDELDALGEIDGLKDALARLRKFGGRCVLGFQSIAQVSGLYGKGSAETIVENCGNTLILRCSASERGGTSEFASKLIGQREVLHTTLSTTRRSGEWRSATSKSEQLRIEPAVMASEIERLQDLAGFLKIASVPDWQAARLTVPPDVTIPRPREVRAVTPDPPPAAPLIESSSHGTLAIQRPMNNPRKHAKGTSARREPAKLSRRAKLAPRDSDTPDPR
ncbi:MAG TPA: type IV secretion system DNA-binding domain-containing protein [Steroidobacteraceae bacterium]